MPRNRNHKTRDKRAALVSEGCSLSVRWGTDPLTHPDVSEPSQNARNPCVPSATYHVTPRQRSRVKYNARRGDPFYPTIPYVCGRYLRIITPVVVLVNKYFEIMSLRFIVNLDKSII